MKIKERFWEKIGVIICQVIFFFIFLCQMGFSGEIKPEEVIKEIVNWTYQQNLGITCLWDLDKKEYDVGAKWQWVKSKHEWLFSGLCADLSPSLGGYISFNLGKPIEKIRGEPLIYLKHLEAGYWKMYDFGEKNWKDGLFLNLIKIEF
jgi:hypothetical protein